MNENIEKNTLLDSEELLLPGTEISVQSDTEIVDSVSGGSAVSGETLAADPTEIDVLIDIYNDIHLIMVFAILTFCTSCLRGWRKKALKGV